MAKKLRQKCKPLQSIYYLMYWLKQVPKGVMEKQAQGKWQYMQKSLQEVYIKLQQHFSTKILCYCLNI